MNNIGKILFLHFEKALVGIFFLGLAYSLVWFGPWRGGGDYDAELAKLAETVDGLPVIDTVPAVPDIAAGIQGVEVPKQLKLGDSYIWQVSQVKNIDIMPPTDVVPKSYRGYIAINWLINPNQETKDTIQFVGVQVERALMTPQGPGPYENRTKVAADREYMTPTELYTLAQKVAAVAPKEQQKKTSARTVEKLTVAPYTIDDLFNALHDGAITETRLRSLVDEGIRNHWYNAEDRSGVNETFMVIRMEMRTSRSATRIAGGANTGKKMGSTDLVKLVLEQMGYPGGGKYIQYIAGQEGGAVPAPGNVAKETKPTPATAKKEEKPEQVVPMTFPEVTIFVDTAVNPDLEYKYRVRFWVADTSGPTSKLRSTDFVDAASVAAPKPDTEFYLSGIVPEQGKASINVRKWLYASNNWQVKSYLVAPGEEIGRVEVVPKKDTQGRVVVEDNKVVMDTVDFSTGCILLGSRSRPKVVESRTVGVAPDDKGRIIPVDKVDYVIYDTPQIVYSDRKGILRVKWKGTPESTS